MHNAVIIRHKTQPGHRIVALAIQGDPDSPILRGAGAKWCGQDEEVAGTCNVYDDATLPAR